MPHVVGQRCPKAWAIVGKARYYFSCVAYLPNAYVFTTALGSKGNMKICNASCRKKNTRKRKVNEIFFVLLHPE